MKIQIKKLKDSNIGYVFMPKSHKYYNTNKTKLEELCCHNIEDIFIVKDLGFSPKHNNCKAIQISNNNYLELKRDLLSIVDYLDNLITWEIWSGNKTSTLCNSNISFENKILEEDSILVHTFKSENPIDYYNNYVY